MLWLNLKEIETQYLLKQRRQATENERRRRNMELELLKAARKKIPVLDRTEGKKHSVVLENKGSDDFRPKPKEPLLQTCTGWVRVPLSATQQLRTNNT